MSQEYNQLNQQLQDIQTQLSDEKAKGIHRNQARITDLENQEAATLAKMDIAKAAMDKQQRQQDQAVIVDKTKEILAQAFEALFPKDQWSKIMGLTEYEAKQQDFNQLIDAFTSESHQETVDYYELEIKKKDESTQKQISDLTAQQEDLHKQIAAADQSEKEKDAKITVLQTQLDTANKAKTDAEQKLTDLQKVADEKDTQIQSLQTKLDETKKQPAKQPSKTVQDAIKSVQAKSLKDLTPDELQKRWEARQNGNNKITIPSIGGTSQSGATFPAGSQTNATPSQNNDPSAVSQMGGQNTSTTEVTAPKSFQVNAGIQGVQQPTDSQNIGNQQPNVGQASAKSTDEKIADIEKELAQQRKEIDELKQNSTKVA